jgi:hypothetical protein
MPLVKLGQHAFGLLLTFAAMSLNTSARLNSHNPYAG